uniref:IS3 family transposase n=1 Tax=Radiobacillus kanasensis TaxID=2844358 RepID=UPI0038B5981C
MESFHSVIKKELIFHEKYQTRDGAKQSIFAYIMTFYNYKRIHSTINYMSPLQYEIMYLQQIKATA